MIVRVMRENGRWTVESANKMLDPRLRVLSDEDVSLDALYARLSVSVTELLGAEAAGLNLHMVAFEGPK